MAKIESIELKDKEIILSTSISDEERGLLNDTKEIIILPEVFDESLTTGKLGNSNRVMLPKKILKRHNIELKGKVPARVFDLGNKKLLLIKLEEKKIGIPEFKEDEEK